MGYLTTIDVIEGRTGLDVLWELPDDVEDRVERELNEGWARRYFE